MQTNFRGSKFRIIFTAAAIGGMVAAGAHRIAAQGAGNLDRDAILNHLNAVITWYRDTTNKVQPVGLPTDAIYEGNAQSFAAEAVRLAFQSARAEAAVIAAEDQSAQTNNQPASGNPGQQQNLSQMEARIAAEIEDVQTKLDGLNKEIAAAAPSKRPALISTRDKLTGELTLDKAVQDTIDKMADFVESNNETAGGLQGSINQLAHSVPEVLGGGASQKGAPAAANANANASQNAAAKNSGLIGQALGLFTEVQAMHEIDQMLSETARLRQTAENLRQPLRQVLSATIQQGRDLANQTNAQTVPGNAPAPEKKSPPKKSGNKSSPPSKSAGTAASSANSTQSAQEIQNQFRDLTAKFKQLANAALPLSQEIVVIEQSRANYMEWRKSIARESKNTLRSLLVRVIGIAIALAALLGISEVWRRLTFRYVHEARRRRQFLLMRRFVMGFLIGIVLILGFVSEFSSLATFAGFVTAGIAVGLQAVLLSVAAYFFVIGRYGIRVGDRISVAGVTGDVIDIGLVRLYIMELAGTGIDLYPTGRIVVFSNSVLFQAGTPLFKQIPGTEYAWHEVAIALAPTGNYKSVQEKVLKAVTSVYERYRPDLQRQHGEVERDYEVQISAPEPESKLQFTDAGLEFLVRFPVDIRKASEIDDLVTRALLESIAGDPEIKAAVTGSPKIRAAIKG